MSQSELLGMKGATADKLPLCVPGFEVVVGFEAREPERLAAIRRVSGKAQTGPAEMDPHLMRAMRQGKAFKQRPTGKSFQDFKRSASAFATHCIYPGEPGLSRMGT